MFGGTAVIVSFVILALLVILVIAFIVRSAIREVEQRNADLDKSKDAPRDTG